MTIYQNRSLTNEELDILNILNANGYNIDAIFEFDETLFSKLKYLIEVDGISKYTGRQCTDAIMAYIYSKMPPGPSNLLSDIRRNPPQVRRRRRIRR
jgi:hypothetical protein